MSLQFKRDPKTKKYSQKPGGKPQSMKDIVFDRYRGWPGTFWIERALRYLNDSKLDICKYDIEQEFNACQSIKDVLQNYQGDIKDTVLNYNESRGALWRALYYISQNIVT